MKDEIPSTTDYLCPVCHTISLSPHKEATERPMCLQCGVPLVPRRIIPSHRAPADDDLTADEIEELQSAEPINRSRDADAVTETKNQYSLLSIFALTAVAAVLIRVWQIAGLQGNNQLARVLVGIVGGGLGSLFTGIAIVSYARTVRLSDTGKRTRGVVCEHRLRGRIGDRHVCAMIRYRVNGQVYEIASALSGTQARKWRPIGKQYTVVYDPDAPLDAIVEEASNFVVTCLCGLLGVITLIASVVGFFFTS